MFKVYDKEGNPFQIHHPVDVRESLRTGRYFLEPPNAKTEAPTGEGQVSFTPDMSDIAEIINKTKVEPADSKEDPAEEASRDMRAETPETGGKRKPGGKKSLDSWNS